MKEEETVDAFFAAEESICKLFGYKHDWRVFPVVDHREYLWKIDGGQVVFAHQMSDFPVERYYQNTIYTYRHLKQHVWRSEKFTMVLCDTHTDMNIWLAVFDNSKEIKEEIKV